MLVLAVLVCGVVFLIGGLLTKTGLLLGFIGGFAVGFFVVAAGFFAVTSGFFSITSGSGFFTCGSPFRLLIF